MKAAEKEEYEVAKDRPEDQSSGAVWKSRWPSCEFLLLNVHGGEKAY